MKLYKLTRNGATLALLAVLGSTASASQGVDDPPSLVAHFRNYGDSSVSDIRLRGFAQGLEYVIAGSKTEDQIVFDIALADRAVQLRIPKTDFPGIDLRTIREGISEGLELRTLRFDVEFGALGECFADPESPQRLVVAFDVDGQISASRLAANGCELGWQSLGLVPTGASSYTASTVDRESD